MHPLPDHADTTGPSERSTQLVGELQHCNYYMWVCNRKSSRHHAHGLPDRKRDALMREADCGWEVSSAAASSHVTSGRTLRYRPSGTRNS